MQTKHLCVLTHIKGPRRYFFCGSFMYLFCLVFAMCCARRFICALWSPVGKGLTSWLSFLASNCEFVTFPSIVSILDLCTLTYF